MQSRGTRVRQNFFLLRSLFNKPNYSCKLCQGGYAITLMYAEMVTYYTCVNKKLEIFQNLRCAILHCFLLWAWERNISIEIPKSCLGQVFNFKLDSFTL
jgi:hypothetical protein